ncbi:MAG: transglutaminase domain-containing protein [Acholeplasmataceae bacterium]|jgi:hypothetical protein
MKNKILLVLISLFLVLGISKFEVKGKSQAEIDADANFASLIANIENTHEYYFEVNELTTKGQELYRLVLEHFSADVDNYNKDIEWVIKAADIPEENETKKALVTFLYDYKVFFWLTGDIAYSYESIPLTPNVKYTITLKALDIYNDKQVFLQDLAEVVQNQQHIKTLVDEQPNTYLKIKVIHDWLLENNTYKSTGHQTNHSPVGVLVEGYDPVCEAYAEAFLMLANHNNIKAIYGTGRANNGERTEDHAWNYVYVLDKYYFLDVTWDKPGTTINYNYFLTTMPASHIKTNEEIMPTPFTTANYQTDNMVNIIVDTDTNYLYSGSAINGYNTIEIEGKPTVAVKITYYDSDGTKLAGAPKDIGKYYLVATPDPSSGLVGDLRVNFEIIPKINKVRFLDFETHEVIKVENVPEGGNATLPVSTKNGYKLVPQSNDYQNVTSNVDIYIKEERINVTFTDDKGQSLEVTLADHIYETNYPNELTGINMIFVGWTVNGKLVTEETVLTTDVELKPLIEEIKIEGIKGAKYSDGVYKIGDAKYGVEEITLTSKNQFIVGTPVVSEVSGGKYTITIKVGAKGSPSVEEIELQMEQSSMLPFDLKISEIIFYAVIGVVAIVMIAIIASVIKHRKDE